MEPQLPSTSPEKGPPEGLRIADAYTWFVERWPLVVACALAGAVLAYVLGLASPRRFAAEAEVVVDSHVELVLPIAHQNTVAAYLNQQALRLESIAYSDEVWTAVVETMVQEGLVEDAASGRSLIETVRLPHPTDGVWRFLVYHRDPGLAARLASVWALSFVDQVDQAIRVAQQDQQAAAALQGAGMERIRRTGTCAAARSAVSQLEAVAAEMATVDPESPPDPVRRLTLEAAYLQAGGVCAQLAACRSPSTTADLAALSQAILALRRQEAAACEQSIQAINAEIEALQAERSELVTRTLGLSAVTEVALTRSASVPTRPVATPGWWLLIGAAVGSAASVAVDFRRLRRDRPAGRS